MNPVKSVIAVKKIEELWAGSKWKRFSKSGMLAPASPATPILSMHARKRTSDIIASCVMIQPNDPDTTPRIMPLQRPLKNSRKQIVTCSPS